jgi:hypothetical protein
MEPRSERSTVQELVDAMLQRAQTQHPQAEYSIIMAAEQTLLLPRHADQLWRIVNGRLGYYRCHVNRDHEVVAMPFEEDDLVLLSPLQTVGQRTPASIAPTYTGNLTTGAVSISGAS